MTAQLAFLGTMELWVLLIIALLLFGTRIPGIAKSLGLGITEFKKGLKGDDEHGSERPKISSEPDTTRSKGDG